jgi:NAD(P)-dependent dehydrogenase (short-subunit alcohol dehydrogenase family)
VRAELGVPGEVDALFDAVSSGFAGGPLHVLVNNVGVGGQTARSSRPPTNSSTASSP